MGDYRDNRIQADFYKTKLNKSRKNRDRETVEVKGKDPIKVCKQSYHENMKVQIMRAIRQQSLEKQARNIGFGFIYFNPLIKSIYACEPEFGLLKKQFVDRHQKSLLEKLKLWLCCK